MKQKLLTLFAALLCSMTTFADGIKIGKLYYDIGNYDIDDPTALSAAVIPSEGEPYSGDIVIPSSVQYNGETYAVTYISDDAFANSTGLTSIVVPNSVQVVGVAAFYHCTSLTSVSIGSGVRGIQESAFEDCTALTDVTIDSDIAIYGHHVFRDCTSLPVVDGIRYAGPYLVEVVDIAETYTIREGTKWIGEYAFCGQTPTWAYLHPLLGYEENIYNEEFQHIPWIHLPSTLKGIGDFAFFLLLLSS